MSSRNQYLTDSERLIAPKIYENLCAMRKAYQQGVPLEQIEQQAVQNLEQAGFEVDYVEILSSNLGKASRSSSKQRVALIAARLGLTRLIDNLEFDIN